MTARRPLGVFLVVLLVAQLAALAVRWPDRPGAPSPERAATVDTPVPGSSTSAPAPTDPPPAPPEETPPHPLVGAHYHVWYPSNFDQGFLRGRLEPAQEPALGRYRSDDPAVAEQQIAWASAAGIDFFTVDWWPTRPQQNANALAGLLQAPNIDDIDIAAFYEVWDLGFDPATEATVMDPPTIDRFVADMEQVAATFFDHPSYLRVDGRPVVILYLSRTMTGDVAGAIARVRQRMAELGHDVLLIGDEVFWRPLNPDRMRLFDAITAYNLYDSDKPEHRGFGSETPLVADQVELYRSHAAAVDGSVPVVPGVLPGYNDRGVRPSLGHFAIPRRWAPDRPEGSTLREMIDQVAQPLLDPRLPMFFVTSWNEWNEDTAIEPLAPAEETGADTSDTDTMFTDGFTYGGGSTQLDALRDEVVAVAGRVVGRGGAVRSGVRVEARAGDRLVAADTTDAAGRFTLSRWLLTGGEVVVSTAGDRTRVQVDAERAVEVELRA